MKNIIIKNQDEAAKILPHLDPLTASILVNRGITSAEEASIMLSPSYDDHVHDPFLMKDMEKMKVRFDGLKKLTRLPDVVFVSSLKESALPVREAKKMGIKVIGIANTDSNPDEVDYIIPANDRSKRSVDLIVDMISKELAG